MSAIWTIGGQAIETATHTREPNALTLEARVRTAAERATLSDLKDDAGSYTERVRADGVFEARDTVGGSNTVSVSPPAEYAPPREAGDYLVDDVTATRTSADGTAERATVSLVPRESRALETTATPSAGGSWSLAFQLATVETDRVASEITNDGDRVELTLALTPAETDVLEASTGAVGGVVSERLPDADTRVRDVTPNSRQTVTLTPPAASPIPAGDYVTIGWRTEAITTARHQTTITLDAV
jgi:hypothetical protein